MLTQYFETAIPTAIAAGLGALHIKDRMSSINEVDMDEILPTMGNALRKAVRYVANKSEDFVDDAGHFARKAGRYVANKSQDAAEDISTGAKALKNKIKDKIEDYNDKPGIFKKATRLYRDKIDLDSGEYAKEAKQFLRNKSNSFIQSDDDTKTAMGKKLRAAIRKQADELDNDRLNHRTI